MLGWGGDSTHRSPKSHVCKFFCILSLREVTELLPYVWIGFVYVIALESTWEDFLFSLNAGCWDISLVACVFIFDRGLSAIIASTILVVFGLDKKTDGKHLLATFRWRHANANNGIFLDFQMKYEWFIDGWMDGCISVQTTSIPPQSLSLHAYLILEFEFKFEFEYKCVRRQELGVCRLAFVVRWPITTEPPTTK